MENTIKTDDLGGTPIFGNTHMYHVSIRKTINAWPNTPWKFNIAPENVPGPKRRVVFQPSFFRGYDKLREGSTYLQLPTRFNESMNPILWKKVSSSIYFLGVPSRFLAHTWLASTSSPLYTITTIWNHYEITTITGKHHRYDICIHIYI